MKPAMQKRVPRLFHRAGETEGWLDYSRDCKYIDMETHNRLMCEYDEVRKMLISMIHNPNKFCT